ncbi:MAG: Gfo/Idh/MocA family oxidoreductase [Chloroflexi bacterium]|nr:Gfo/Idh/MocA family oxidoreductase [Chloroflexota bacterium]
MKQVFIKQGQAVVEDVPAPGIEDGTVLIRVHHSCISIGTEMSGLRGTADPLWLRALKDPRKVVKAARMVASKGLGYTRDVVEGTTLAGAPTGYTAAGSVLQVAADVQGIQPGDRVACAGAQYAHHAEIVRVPVNLVVPIPENVATSAASSVALGAIALQGVRRAAPTLGESFVVIGLGLLGQLTVQMLKANGCRVIATDLARERVALALQLGADASVHPDDGDSLDQVMRVTDGIGADGVIITAATPSDEVMSSAFKMCRRKGRVVLVGDVGLHLNRADFYAKELDFFISTSYGPGRYDNRYEEQGYDYPAAYVRWTENRNMSEYLRLLSEGRVRLEPLQARIFPVEKAGEAYDALKGADRPLMAILSYPPEGSAARSLLRSPMLPASAGRVRLAIIGAGDFAKGMHLPNLKVSQRYQLAAVMSRTGHNAANTAKTYNIPLVSTDYAEILQNADIDAVLIATRHNLHAAMTLQALHAGKHALVEKPLGLTDDEIRAVEAFYAQRADQKSPLLLTGFNRRFSPFAQRLRELTAARSNPMILNYRMNAGYIPLTHWTHSAEGGGRNLGEACHIYDLFTFLTDSAITRVHAQHITPRSGYYSAQDNFVATMTFADGSVATLTYTALGAKAYPKEQMEVFCDGKVYILHDYHRLEIVGAKTPALETAQPDKGHKTEIEAFARAIQEGGDWPIALWQQLQASDIALAVERHLSPENQA